MTKQTKQIIVLIVLVVVAGGVALFTLGGGDDTPAPAPPPANTGATPSTPGGTTPAEGAGPTATVPNAGPGAVPAAEVQQDLDMPEPVKLTPPRYSWQWEAPIGGEGAKYGAATGIFPPFDPLVVQNIDVVDPDRKAYIEELKAEWIIDGITITEQKRPVLDENGKQLLGESVMVPKPKTRKVARRDENGEVVFDETGKAVMEDVIVYEPELDSRGKPRVDENGNPVYVQIPLLDDDGNEVKDEAGEVVMVPKPVYEQAKDEFGEPVTQDGKPVWVMQPKYDAAGKRVVKKVQQVQRLQKIEIIDGKKTPIFDDNGQPVIEEIKVVDDDGNPVMVPDNTPQFEVKKVIEVWFKDHRRPYREKDRLTNTRFIINKIFTNRVYEQEGGGTRVRAGVDLLGDTGAKITLNLSDDARYGTKADGG
ncbi:MAG: hypothetical protein KDB68_03975 [Planctomycetes bacterium]|nr:hypothetical protein [Planctomycetota bacterium]